MKIKIFDTSHEKDLEEAINKFAESHEIVDIKFSTCHFYDTGSEETIYCFTALIIYK